MTLKRLLGVAIAIALALRIAPVVLPWIRPRWRASAERLRLRADVATAAIMVAFAIAAVARGEPWIGVLVLVLGAPAYAAVGQHLAAWWRR
jgi:hypothetical protein